MEATPLSALGATFMLVSVSSVTLLVAYCYRRVFSIHD